MLGQFHHVSLCVADLERSVDFYVSLFQFSRRETYVQSDGRGLVHLAAAGCAFCLELIEVERVADAPGVHLGFHTEDFEGALRRLRALGVPMPEEPTRVGRERILFIRDPDGYTIEINDRLPDLGNT